jgi:hypothetical protein
MDGVKKVGFSGNELLTNGDSGIEILSLVLTA